MNPDIRQFFLNQFQTVSDGTIDDFVMQDDDHSAQDVRFHFLFQHDLQVGTFDHFFRQPGSLRIVERYGRNDGHASEAPIMIQEITTMMNTPEGTYHPIIESIHIHPSLIEIMQRALWRLEPLQEEKWQ